MGWQISRFGLLLLPLVTLWLLLWRQPTRITLMLALLAAELMLAAIIWLSGHQATLLSQQGSRLARTSFASGLWCSGALILLLITDQVRQLTRHRLAQLLLNLQVWLLPLLLLFSGQLSNLSLLKEYANRHAVFDAALSRHLTLLAGTVVPALMIALPLGVTLFRRPGWQGGVFGVLNVIQTMPSVALFGLLIAPLAGLAQQFPWLGDWASAALGWLQR